jgi:hypothetical protein
MDEYILSYTAEEIDEKLGKIDELATEEYVDNAIANISLSTNKKWELMEEFVADGTKNRYVRKLDDYGFIDASAVMLECIYPILTETYGIYNQIHFNPLINNKNPNHIFSWSNTKNNEETRFTMMVDKENAIIMLRANDGVQQGISPTNPSIATVIIDSFVNIVI